MDSGFVDLDILISRIRNTSTKKYFLDSVKAYKAGALRAALTSTWVALVYDLIAKYRELSAHNEATATSFIQLWDNATANQDLKKLLELEKDILVHAKDTTQILNSIEFTQLSRLREDRHLCAHPAYSAEAELFEPSHELVRLHLVNVVDLVFAREARQGRAIFDVFSADIQSPGFPSEHGRILDYVESRYLARVRATNVPNFGVVLAKSLLKGVPPEWEPHRSQIVSSLVAVSERAPASWQETTGSIVRIIDNVEPAHRPRAIAFLANFPSFWALLQAPTHTALQETAANIDPNSLADYYMLAGITLAPLREAIQALISEMNAQSLISAISQVQVPELWARGIEVYRNSGGFRSSEDNFRRLVVPFAHQLNSDNFNTLFSAITDNAQNWDAAQTPSILLSVLQNAKVENRPSVDMMTGFYERCDEFNRVREYEPVFELFSAFGWQRPAEAEQ
ncbi:MULTISPECIES: hypothetical protein [Pseudomonas]|uniref:hypothetical protein n=1 Tax=Pseudomonas TaxID=286 RepID=UPI0011AFB48D|nr:MULTISPECIES: hypothetical protein [Pseudomonas]